MNQIICEGADPQQQKAVCHKDGPLMVLAGPGAGKTFVITRRLKYLIDNCGIPPEEILVISFTKAAAEEMECRFNALCGELSGVTFGTFHAVYFHILKKFYNLDRSSIISEGEKRKYIRQAANGLKFAETDEETVSALLDVISGIKNAGLDEKAYKAGQTQLDAESFGLLYRSYHKLLKENRKLDFDDMVLRCRELFIERPDILDMWREQYKYILIDEFQDINPMQYTVIRMIAAPSDNICVVGDDDQSIYAFRGSDPEIMLNFKKDYPAAMVVKLENNYRSGREIVECAGRLIGCNRKRFKKKIRAGRTVACAVVKLSCADRNAEAEKICGLIKAAVNAGISHKEIALLFRTNAVAGYFAGRMTAAGIPFYIRDRAESMFDGNEGRDIRAMLDFSKGKCSRENFLRFMNKPLRYISRAEAGNENIDLKELLNNSDPKKYMYGRLKRLIYDMEKLKNMHPFAAVNYIRKGMGYEQYVVNEAEKNGRDPSSVTEVLDLLQEAAGE